LARAFVKADLSDQCRRPLSITPLHAL